MGLIEDVRKKAKEKRIQIDNDMNATEEEKETIRDIIAFLSNEQDFNRISRGTFFNIFAYIGYEIDINKYLEMYDAIMKEAGETYTYVDSEAIKK